MRAGRRKFSINIRATNPEKGESNAQETLVASAWITFRAEERSEIVG